MGNNVTLIPKKPERHSLLTSTEDVVYMPLGSKDSHGILQVGDNLVVDKGIVSLDLNGDWYQKVLEALELSKSEILILDADGEQTSSGVEFTIKNHDKFEKYKTDKRRFLIKMKLPVLNNIDKDNRVYIHFGSKRYLVFSFVKGMNSQLTLKDLQAVVRKDTDGYSYFANFIYLDSPEFNGFVLDPAASAGTVTGIKPDGVTIGINSEGELNAIALDDGFINIADNINFDDFKGFVHLTKEQFDKIRLYGEIEINGKILKYDDSVVYITPEITEPSNSNLVINGDFSVNQKGKSRYSASGYYTADGWQLGRDNDGYFDVSTKTLSCGTSGTYAILTQYVNVDIVSLKGKQLTLSADIKGDGVNTVYLQFGYFTGSEFTQIAVNIIRTASTTMSRYVITGTIPDNVTSINKLAVRPYINAGNCVIDNIKLELGSVATTYNPRPYAEELAMCQMPSISGNQNLSTTYSNENILINGDFRVNQRNFTSTTDIGFTVDRWKNARENTAVTLNDDGTITLSSTPTQYNNTLMTQKLEEKDYKNLLGGAITVSAMVSLDEGQTYHVYSTSAVLPETLPTTIINNEAYFTDDSGIRHGSVRQYWTGSQFTVDVFGYNGYKVRVKWVKLEKGSVATHYSPRPYVEELSLCQRYYQKLGINDTGYYNIGENIFYVHINLINTLRTEPTISVITYPSISGNGTNFGRVDNLTFTELKDNLLICTTDTSSLPYQEALGPVVYKIYAGNITVDAEIY